MIPYSRQKIDDDDIAAVVASLRSDWLTTGPKIAEFEESFAGFAGAKYAVAVSNGTAALHAAMYALDIRKDDEVIVTAMSFAASANCVVYQGGKPVFCDIEEDTFLIDPSKIEEKITRRTKAIIAVDYAGQPCEYDALTRIARKHGLFLVDDACHALGARYKQRTVGSFTDLSVFSFHAVKHITTGEGGMIVTNDKDFADRMRLFRNHGIASDHHQREAKGSWFYEMTDLGYNYRLTDFQCALGISQLAKQPQWLKRRREIALKYDNAFSGTKAVRPLLTKADVEHARHLYICRFDLNKIGKDRNTLFKELRTAGIGVNVHYIPIHLHPFYRNNFGTGPGLCPVAERVYECILSIPMYHGMSESDANKVIEEVLKAANEIS